ncbi:hypothetical protein CRYUN_Cryun08bG0023400 [Craigia yunnanensis]
MRERNLEQLSFVFSLFFFLFFEALLISCSFEGKRVKRQKWFCFLAKMYKQALMGDAWIREAQEASKLVEDIETRVNNKNPTLKHQENGLVDITARSKLLEAGIKLDRLESLLRNPPSKPILTNEDLNYRWKMLSDMQLRTKALALSLYALPTSSRPGYLTPGNAKATDTTVNDHEQV